MTAALHTLWTLLRDAVAAFFDDDVPSLGAALAYYTLFSITPLLLIVLALAGAVFGDEAARGGLIGELRGLMGDDGARAVEALLASVGRDGNTLPATLGGLGVLLIGATSVFAELQSAMDRIWRVPADLSPLRGSTDFGSRREAQDAAAGTPPAETAAPAPRAASLVARRPSP
jgi:membrane protein